MRRMLQSLAGCWLFLFVVWGNLAHAGVDNSLYADLLSKHVVKGLVDYAGLKQDEAALDQYQESLSSVNPETLGRDAQFAYFINVYNAWTLRLVLQHYPGIDSIKDIGGFWTGPWEIKLVELHDGKVTLDHIEHGILRPRFKDPRVHFAVNCASRGCPSLHDKPFEASTLDETLDELTRRNINDPRFNRFENGTLYLVKVFDWFAFVLKYADEDLKKRIQGHQRRMRIRYTEWGWSLNDAGKTR